MVNRQSSVVHCSTNLVVPPTNPNPLTSAEHLASDGPKVGLSGSETGKNVLHQKLLHEIFGIRMPHDEGGEADGHTEGAIFLTGLGVRAQDIVNSGEDWPESDLRSTLHQLDEEGRHCGERGVKVITIICVVVSLDYESQRIGSSSPTCWRTRSMGSECQSSSLPGVKAI